MTPPNTLTMLRILLVPFFVVFVYFEKYPVCQVLALVLFISASITDLLDGRIARSRNLVTDFGKFMDPIADKLLVMSAFVMLVEHQRMPGWVCILMLAREFIVSGFRLVASGKGKVIAADMFGKVKTFIQDIAIFVLLCSGSFDYEILTVTGYVIFWASVLATLISGFECILKNKNVLSEKE